MSGPKRPVEVVRLEGLFRHIEQTRMVGVPILNPALWVQAVDFIPWKGYQLGVLITPWFMNLILLGGTEADSLAKRRPGEKITHAFPSGLYEFIVAEEPALDHHQGRYQACSLFSPMQPFDSQELAVATAQEIMRGLMLEENRSEVVTRSREIAEAWAGGNELATDTETESVPLEEGPGLSERLETPLTRRELFTGLS
ncbi:[NiFe]-hydrogenase assembly chaperone HybE [Sedimenticola selenatireducens]|uniref:[NiFe]-hydrogenase assembly chaperone HybE n=1 Tax=Sedimenticola selenatireducens TaxID=191960 RepID=UPI0004B2D631|nr:[NiFe]-hydrogenase assembly chaperone HybE [Sedimenticola selenatireducens]